MAEIKVGKYTVLSDLLYTETDEWVKLEGNVATVGITDYAQKKLRDIVGVELPEVGRTFSIGDSVGVVESVKAAVDIYAPLSGQVTEVNGLLTSSPELMNKDPYGQGWIFKLNCTDLNEKVKLMDAENYVKKIQKGE
ncbi:glycine cleavage system protein GcvH [Sulfuracidifex metallicus]|jgi:glycine cleavage system H protein|uniref:Probable glycine cleavage system H protein n=1 Tax=Sulfuracidifex metallicus DSM 6482 = JCM 9184 TaxID=523847 RepID=A0A6A9QI62_SULME|nr:glycine cleavage system protein GcvH [Sulfuracidifex metallicus]MUN27920.1 glycine cleavage system protein GcvH [Sulfuracidifex metallicus DSM 6482 = JCM 9184]WOE51526.1 glycine cleavage system protein GcvH [Sulfuracidifex metallicus DSM 6482 = JCM 9184]